MAPPPPEISVVVPTLGRETRLAFLLEALDGQSVAPERFEVIVVRDAAQAGPLATPPQRLRVRYLTAPGSRGPTDKRNVGWRAATAPLVAFTDDDCRPAPDWLERLLAAADGRSFLQGRTEPDPDERHLLRGLSRSRTVVGPSPWYPGCNVAYPTALLERLGGFDEAFTFGSEDTDLALRARELGAPCRYVDEALVWHAVLTRDLLSAAREALAWPTFPLLFAKHPSYRDRLYLGVFRNRSHAAVCLALASAIARRRSPVLAAALAVPYLGEQVRGNLTPGRRNARAVVRLAAHLPARALLDVLDVVVTAASAASHRVLVV